MTTSSPSSRLRLLAARMVPAPFRTISRTALAFGLVGLGGMCVDLAVFNGLRLGLLGPAFSLASKPLTASVISATFAIVVNWLGSRYWAFRDSRRPDAVREFVEYALVALLGVGIGLATLAFTHYTLGFTSLAADNISKNVIGLALGTATRFVLLRFWVWGRSRGTVVLPASATITAAIPVLTGAIPTLTGAIPTLSGALPALTGAVPIVRSEAA